MDSPPALCLNRFLSVKALLGTFNKEEALAGTFSDCYENCREVPLPPLGARCTVCAVTSLLSHTGGAPALARTQGIMDLLIFSSPITHRAGCCSAAGAAVLHNAACVRTPSRSF